MTLVKAIEFETYTIETDEDGNRQFPTQKWLVPDSDYVYYAIAEKRYVRDIHVVSYFDFYLAKSAYIPNWLPSAMVSMMIEDDKEEWRAGYETDMTNGYGTIHNDDEMFGDY